MAEPGDVVALFTLDYPGGNRIVRKVHAISDEDMAKAKPILDAFLAETGCSAEELAVMVVEIEHRERIYREVAQARGVLAL